MTVKKKLIAGNWKMNGNLEANDALVRAVVAGMKDASCEVAVCVYGENAKTGMPMLFGRAQMGRGQGPSDDIAYGLAGGPIILFVGRLIREKRIADLLQAVHRVYNGLHEVQPIVVIVGDGADRDRARG